LKSQAENVSSRVGSNVMDLLSLFFYTAIMYTMKALEFVIAVSQSNHPSIILINVVRSYKHSLVYSRDKKLRPNVLKRRESKISLPP
jgi:hypothetical protein